MSFEMTISPEKKDAIDRIIAAIHNNEDAAGAFSKAVAGSWPDGSLDYTVLREKSIPELAGLTREEKVEITSKEISESLTGSTDDVFSEVYALQLSWSPEKALRFAEVAESAALPSPAILAMNLEVTPAKKDKKFQLAHKYR